MSLIVTTFFAIVGRGIGLSAKAAGSGNHAKLMRVFGVLVQSMECVVG